MAAVRERSVPHNVGRAAFRTQMARRVRRDLLRRRSPEVVTTEAVDAELRADRAWGRTLDRLWPQLGAPALVRRVLTSRVALAAAADGVLAADEQAAIRRPATRRIGDEPWTAADLALLDEAEALVSGPPRAYGHVVVDEAQDLSAMGLRALARRSRDASMTVLGDLAQATAPGAQVSWEAAIEHLGARGTAQRADLDLGYRVPASIMDMANGLLAEAAPDVTPTRSVRPGGRAPTFAAVDTGGPGAPVGDEVGRVAVALAAVYASIAVIVPPQLRGPVASALAGVPGGGSQVTLLDPSEAKGLEFDAVVVVEPAAIAGGTPRGLRLLYVALTRAVQELVVVHADPLPPGLHPTRPLRGPSELPEDRSRLAGGGRGRRRRRSDVGDGVVGQRDAALGAGRRHGLGEHVLHEEQVAGHVVGGCQLLRVALEVHELLAHQHQLAHRPGAVLALQLELLPQQLGQAHLAERQVEHRIEHELEPGGHLVDRSDVVGEDADGLP